jgi:hypothetical protein
MVWEGFFYDFDSFPSHILDKKNDFTRNKSINTESDDFLLNACKHHFEL